MSSDIYCNGSIPEPVSTVNIDNSVVNYNNYAHVIGDLFEYPILGAIPNGSLLCDGREIGRVTYAELFAVIGTTYGSGDGSITFNIPDLQSTDSSLLYYIQAEYAASQIVTTAGIVPYFTDTGGGVWVIGVKTADGVLLTGYYEMRVWFTDSATDLNIVSITPPTTPGVPEMNIVTDAAGHYNLTLAGSGSWILCASIAGSIGTQGITL